MRIACAIALLLAGAAPMAAEETDREAAVRVAREGLAAELQVAPASITVKGVEATEWTDSNLGCAGPSAGAPLQMPGFKVLLSVEGRDHEVHVGAGRAVRCPQGVPSGDARPGEGARPGDARPSEARGRLIARVRADLARRLGIDVSEVKLKTSQPASWPDQGLGCPRPGESYAQVVTEGQSLELEAKGRSLSLPYQREPVRLLHGGRSQLTGSPAGRAPEARSTTW